MGTAGPREEAAVERWKVTRTMAREERKSQFCGEETASRFGLILGAGEEAGGVEDDPH